jgi:hypothetical protein
MERCCATMAKGTCTFSNKEVLKLVGRLLVSGLTAAATFPRSRLFVGVCLRADTVAQRNFTEIAHVGGEVTASLWLEVKNKNDEFGE